MPPKNDVPLDPKEAKRLAKLEAEEKKRQLKEKIEQQKVKDAELEVLRAKVKKMLLYRQPPSSLEYVASVVPKFMANPWLFVHDLQFTNKFLDEAASVLKEYGHITPDVLRPVEADAKALLAQYQKKEEQLQAAANSVGRVASPEPKEKDAATVAAEEDLESRMSSEEKERRKQAQLLLMHEGLRDLSDFAIGQPAFFITDISVLKRLVRTLQMLMDNEKVFSRLLSLLSPTMKNTALHPLIAEAKLIPPIMEFIMRHMPETSEDPEVLDARERAVVRPKTSVAENPDDPAASGEEAAANQDKSNEEQNPSQADQSADKSAPPPGEPLPAAQEDANGKPLRHTYSMETFQAVFNAIRLLSVSSQLRSIFKEDGERYLHLRGMVSGVYKGFNTVQKTYAFRSLQNIVEDSLSEQNISRGNTPAECNAVMLQYWRGHVHELFCDKIAVDPGNVFGGAGRKRLLKSGFADQASLDALNKKNMKRK